MGLFVLVTGRRVALFARGHGKSSVQVFVRNTIGMPCLSLGDKNRLDPKSVICFSCMKLWAGGWKVNRWIIKKVVGKNLSGLTPEHDDDVECSLSDWI